MTHFPFRINLLIFILVYHVESYGYFLSIYKSLGHSIDFVNMKFVVELIVFPIKFYRTTYFCGEFITEILLFLLMSGKKNAPKKKAPGTLPPPPPPPPPPPKDITLRKTAPEKLPLEKLVYCFSLLLLLLSTLFYCSNFC